MKNDIFGQIYLKMSVGLTGMAPAAARPRHVAGRP